MSLFFNTSLKRLNLANNNVAARGAFVLATALKVNQTIRWGWVEVGVEGLPFRTGLRMR